MVTKKLPVALFNGTVVTTNGLYEISNIDAATVRELIADQGFISAVGHEATAEVLSILLGINIPMNRIQFHQQINQLAVALKLNQRPGEGIILQRDEIEAIGYSLKLIKRLK